MVGGGCASAVAHYVGVLYPDGTYAGDNEFRFYGYDIAGFEDVARARGEHGQFVDFDTYAVADESRMVAVPHEVFLHSGVGCHSGSKVVEVGGFCARTCGIGYGAADVGRELVGGFRFFRDGSAGYVAARHVGHVAGVVAVDVDHHGYSGPDDSAVGAHGQRRVQTFAAHGKVVGRRGVGVLARKHIAHV